MKTLVFYVPTNTHGKHDGDEFAREATKYSLMHDGTECHPIQYVKGQAERQVRMQDVSDLCEMHQARGDRFTSLCVFCHGWSNGIQLGYKVTDGTVYEFARCLELCCTPACRVALYCCSTAHDRDHIDREAIGPGTEGGFADELWKALSDVGFRGHRIDAHFTAGHTTRNPYVVRFEGDYFSDDYQGGEWIVDPKSSVWKQWRHELTGTLRFRFPFMTRGEIHRELIGLPPERSTPLPKMVKNQY